MKHIAFFTSQFQNVKSGPGTFANYLLKFKFETIDFTIFTDDCTQSTLDSLGKIDRSRVILCKKNRLLSKLPLYWIIRYYNFYLTFKRANHTLQFDYLMFSSAYEALYFGKLLNKSYVMFNDVNYATINSHFSFKSINNFGLKKLASRIPGYFIEKYISKNCYRVISNSFYTRITIQKKYNLPGHKVLNLYKAVNPDLFTLKKLTMKPVRNFLFIKNDWRRGGLDLILRGLALLDFQKDITITVAGIPDQEMDEVLLLSKRSCFTGELKMFGLISQMEVIDLLNDNDAYIMLSRSEALGVTLIEALAVGLVVIGSNVGGIPEVLDNGRAGFLVSTESELVNVLNQIGTDPSSLVSKLNHAKEHVTKFTTEVMKKRIEDIYTTDSN